MTAGLIVPPAATVRRLLHERQGGCRASRHLERVAQRRGQGATTLRSAAWRRPGRRSARRTWRCPSRPSPAAPPPVSVPRADEAQLDRGSGDGVAVGVLDADRDRRADRASGATVLGCCTNARVAAAPAVTSNVSLSAGVRAPDVALSCLLPARSTLSAANVAMPRLVRRHRATAGQRAGADEAQFDRGAGHSVAVGVLDADRDRRADRRAGRHRRRLLHERQRSRPRQPSPRTCRSAPE